MTARKAIADYGAQVTEGSPPALAMTDWKTQCLATLDAADRLAQRLERTPGAPLSEIAALRRRLATIRVEVELTANAAPDAIIRREIHPDWIKLLDAPSPWCPPHNRT